jgi:hypothetical protein
VTCREPSSSLTTRVGAPTSAFIECVRQRTLNMISHDPDFWPCVDALAQELLEKRTLSYRTAKQLLDRTRERLLKQVLESSRASYHGDSHDWTGR